MFKTSRPILVSVKTLCFALGLALLLAGCGQTGPLYLPKKDPAAKNRAGLLGSLWPFMPAKKDKADDGAAPQNNPDELPQDDDPEDTSNQYQYP
jgi:predicted small lipoprotein YifL